MSLRNVILIGALACIDAHASPLCIAYARSSESVIHPETIAEHFDWMHEHGYMPVSLRDTLSSELPSSTDERRVFLVFPEDDANFQQVIVPQLQVFSYPAGVVVNRKRGSTNLGVHASANSQWNNRAISPVLQASTILDDDVVSPQGDRMPVMGARLYLQGENRYESWDEYRLRIRRVFQEAAANARSRYSDEAAVLWNSNDYNELVKEEARKFGFDFDLVRAERRIGDARNPQLYCRTVALNASVSELATALRGPQPTPFRVLRVDFNAAELRADSAGTYLESLADTVARIHPTEVIVEPFVDTNNDSIPDIALFDADAPWQKKDLLTHFIARLHKSTDIYVSAAVPKDMYCNSSGRIPVLDQLVASVPLDGMYIESDPDTETSHSCAPQAQRLADRLRYWRPDLRIAKAIKSVPAQNYVGEDRRGELPEVALDPTVLLELEKLDAERPLIESVRQFAANRKSVANTILMVGYGVAKSIEDLRQVREAGALNFGTYVRAPLTDNEVEELRRELSTVSFPYAHIATSQNADGNLGER